MSVRPKKGKKNSSARNSASAFDATLYRMVRARSHTFTAQSKITDTGRCNRGNENFSTRITVVNRKKNCFISVSVPLNCILYILFLFFHFAARAIEKKYVFIPPEGIPFARKENKTRSECRLFGTMQTAGN